jgi:hypothetical protein
MNIHGFKITGSAIILLLVSSATLAPALSVEICPGGDQVVTKDGSVTFGCTPTGACPEECAYAWSFEGISSSPDTSARSPGEVTFGTEGGKYKVEVTVTDVDGDEATSAVYVYVPKFEITALTFITDHGVMTNGSNASTLGSVYAEPEWKRPDASPGTNTGRNYPISHTRNEKVEVAIRIKAMPIDTPMRNYEVIGSGNGLSYSDTYNLSGGERIVNLTSSEKLDDKIHIIDTNIDWSFELGGGVSSKSTTGSHKIYVLNGPPIGGPSEWRINWAVSSAIGAKDPHEALSAIHWAINKKGVFRNRSDVPSNIWLIADKEPAECIGFALFDNAVIQMLGWGGGAIRYGYVKLDKSSKESSQRGETEGRTNDNARLLYSAGDPIYLNHWEACLRYVHGGVAKYYAGASGIYDSVQEYMEANVTESYWWIEDTKYQELAEDWKQQ